ncbi:TKL protein kinase [Salpingoeca rosetta]|uniref:TKL protein kinase n=1 Tax=Salpingoeca rosetta (strain ATCC 50818 / BSB-021) TaxID=946362 RepID=F2UJL1_SALR5|nr:TKL protein kinase [Salpingoeca rosetta]EGD77310.1 TKL protein kinase [Salpingoeca rosetta]|eukprot:XP_004990654.1 TKL protein kinase [Salpingoeca rosetta]
MQTRKRSRRDTPSAGTCTLSSVLAGTCAGSANNASLTIAFEGETTVNGSGQAAAALQGISRWLTRARFTGHVRRQPLEWVVQHGDWATVTSVDILGLQSPGFDFSILNPLLDIKEVRMQDSDQLREITTQGFAHASHLTALRLRNNTLASIPSKAFSGMTAVVVLDLLHNRLSAIDPAWFTSLVSLERLVFGHNIITAVTSAHTFQPLIALERLDLSYNDITTVSHHALMPLSKLLVLDLSNNPLRQLSPASFGSMTLLETMALRSARLQALPPRVFAANTRLRALELEDNLLSALDEDVFRGMTTLRRLLLVNNLLSSLPERIFRDMHELRFLSLSLNRLTSLPPALFNACTNLRLLTMHENELTSLPPNIFQAATSIQFLYLTSNRLRNLSPVHFAGMSTLQVLDLENNHLQSFHAEIPSLTTLTLNHNPLTSLPATLAVSSKLRELRLSRHRITAFDLTFAFRSTQLRDLQLDAAPDVHSVGTVDAAHPPPQTQAAKDLRSLSLLNVDVRDVLQYLQELPPLHLNTVRLGWPTADAGSLPLQQICHLLAEDVHEFALVNTRHAEIHLCPDKSFSTVFVQDNAFLNKISVANGLRNLNASGCRQLSALDVPFVDVLDVSETSVHPSAGLCTRWGRRTLFARHARRDSLTLDEVLPALQRCVRTVNVLDLAHSAWLDHPGKLNNALGETVALSDKRLATLGFDPIHSRAAPPLLQVQGTPVECSLQLRSDTFRLQDNPTDLLAEVVYTFHCTCARGFKLTSGGRCVVDNPDIAGIAVGSVIGGLFFGLFVAWLSRRYRGLTKRIDLQEQLLVERDEEVMALKKAWEIEYDELRMIKRVAAGAFGVVFEAEWDTVMVAVKVLQQAVMAFDESTVLEFEKEVEFLQRTRHPNVVRFFGAGTDPNGSPFLVLEFVAMGSLKDLLGKDMDKVLMEVRSRKVEESNSSSGGVRDDVNSVWELKLRLLRDIASGMAFIHSLDQMHRDLKSGNVLVSSSLRAKITDFGSIRQCFTRGGGGGSGRAHGSSHTRLSSSQADDDPQYSQRTGLQTMTSMTLTAGVGTPLYMAPEALMGDKYSFGADVFSFGVLMWEVATQRTTGSDCAGEGGRLQGPPAGSHRDAPD